MMVPALKPALLDATRLRVLAIDLKERRNVMEPSGARNHPYLPIAAPGHASFTFEVGAADDLAGRVDSLRDREQARGDVEPDIRRRVVDEPAAAFAACTLAGDAAPLIRRSVPGLFARSRLDTPCASSCLGGVTRALALRLRCTSSGESRRERQYRGDEALRLGHVTCATREEVRPEPGLPVLHWNRLGDRGTRGVRGGAEWPHR